MKIYNYCHVTGEYLGQSDADPSPLELGVFLIPAHATEIAPPETGENEVAIFAGLWQVVPDYRGADAWDPVARQKVEITEVGKTLADLGLVDAEPPPSPAEVQAALVAAVQNHLDSAAKQYGYDDIKSAVTYADEPAVPKFQAEGRAFRAWRSLVWAACYAMLVDVLDGKRPVPTVDQLIAELPVLEGE